MTLERLIILEHEGQQEFYRQRAAGENTRETISAIVLLRKMILRRYAEQTVNVQKGRVAA